VLQFINLNHKLLPGTRKHGNN